ncbi:MAG: hypothetical protein ACQCXQ_01965 [Verrucomicrobiales bacterium]|nr:hypothetical protein [Verrucomicrobiota bacterium JB025]
MDPYEPPTADEGTAGEVPVVRRIVVAWERLRLIYNAVLLVPGLVVLGALVQYAEMPVGAAVAGGVFVGLGANAAFFLGPLSEFYLSAVFLGGGALGRGRWLIFGAGVVVSLGFFLLVGAVAVLDGKI